MSHYFFVGKILRPTQTQRCNIFTQSVAKKIQVVFVTGKTPQRFKFPQIEKLSSET